jgi:hypothetical protein
MGTSIVLWQDDAVIEFTWILVPDLTTQIFKVERVCIDLCHYMILSPEAGFPHFSVVLFGQIHQLVQYPLR